MSARLGTLFPIWSFFLVLSLPSWSGGPDRVYNPVPLHGDMFGSAVAVVGDRICVAAPGTDIGPYYNLGTIYLFDRETGAWEGHIPTPYFTIGGEFGRVMVPCGDGHLVSSIYNEVAFVLDVQTEAVTATLNDPDGPTGGFGYAVASDGDLVAVSDAFQEFGGGDGAVHLYDATTGAHLRTLPHPNPLPSNSSLGSSLLFDGNVLYIGSIYSRTPPMPGAGEAYAVDLTDDSVLAVFSDPTNGQNLLGASLAKVGNRLAVGPGYDDGFPYGYLYLYDGLDTTPDLTLRSPGLADSGLNDHFGRAMATWGSFLVVSAPRGPGAGDLRGVVYVYDPATGDEVARFQPAPGDDVTDFGSSLFVDGNDLFVGARGFDDPDVGGPGTVYVFALQAPTAATSWMLY